jgi:hypothetical protein
MERHQSKRPGGVTTPQQLPRLDALLNNASMRLFQGIRFDVLFPSLSLSVCVCLLLVDCSPLKSQTRACSVDQECSGLLFEARYPTGTALASHCA